MIRRSVTHNGILSIRNTNDVTGRRFFSSSAAGITFLIASVLIVLCLILTMSSEFSSSPLILRRMAHHLENNRSSRNLLAGLFVVIIFVASFSILVRKCFLLSVCCVYSFSPLCTRKHVQCIHSLPDSHSVFSNKKTRDALSLPHRGSHSFSLSAVYVRVTIAANKRVQCAVQSSHVSPTTSCFPAGHF